ncbi:MAG: TetR/AcrR family transcriptional regulator [Myxococcales bacterium]|nr:TetR/AcrR family transcriptional regulator [Myxococcales bacterium]MCB9641707.1 TetR/AcrR family transcriptional regulator [Myxococcales bacterium]
MPPRARYTVEKLLEVGLEVIREEGVGALSARSVASRLGASTGPIFTHFSSMDDFTEQLMDRMMEIFVSSTGVMEAVWSGSEDPLVESGVGWLHFAAEEPRLYEALFLRPHGWHKKWGLVRKRLAEKMGEHPLYAELPLTTRFALVGRASIAMHGLGVEIWSGRLPKQDIGRLIREIAMPVVEAALAQGWSHDLHTQAG